MGADMGRQASQVSEDSASRFEKYVGVLTSVVGHADRAASMHYYCVGLVAAEGRKSVEPMAAVTAPTGVSAQHLRGCCILLPTHPGRTSGCWPRCARW